MKKAPLIISAVALVGVIVLFIIVLTGKVGKSGASGTSEEDSESSELTIAYVNTDSVLVNYQMALDLNQEFVKKQQDFNVEFGRKRSDFEKQAVAFQQKVQNGGFLSQDRAVKEQQRLMGQEEEIKRMDYELSNKLSEMEAAINKQLVDSIVSYIKVYNKTKNYTYIFSNTGGIIVGHPKHNISKQILEGLNGRYYAKK